jgi:hypothetical protein
MIIVFPTMVADSIRVGYFNRHISAVLFHEVEEPSGVIGLNGKQMVVKKTKGQFMPLEQAIGIQRYLNTQNGVVDDPRIAEAGLTG